MNEKVFKKLQTPATIKDIIFNCLKVSKESIEREREIEKHPNEI